MLRELSIKNFAIIDDLSVSFSEGLTVLSGETGAGKSIIINAVNLILGTRASARLIRTGTDNAEIEAFFDIDEKSPASKILKNNDLFSDDGLLIRRIISRNDRHKIYINGSIATIQMLAAITENLASISGQHAHQGLLKEDQHLLLLDQFGNLIKLRDTVTEKYHQITPLIKKLKASKTRQQNQADQIELLEFQKKEIEQADISPGEDELLELERIRLKNSELLMQTAKECQQALYTMDGSISETLYELKSKLDKAVEIDSNLSPSSDEINDIVYRIEDLSGALRDYEQSIETDNNRLETIEDRIDLINQLKRKHGGSSGTLADVDRHYKKICHELSDVQNLSGNIEIIEAELSGLYKEMVTTAVELSAKRHKSAEKFARQVEKELKNLEMLNTKFKVHITDIPSENDQDNWLSTENKLIVETGTDKAVFMISPNVGEDMKPLSKTASGGELSRIILALKAILAQNDSVATIVFDEVDAGIGGGIAEVVGKKIHELSRVHQVLCITHLPQIAKFGDNHYQIKKNVSKGRTSTSINRLNTEEKIGELARMLGGVEITDATLNHAKEMLNQR